MERGIERETETQREGAWNDTGEKRREIHTHTHTHIYI